MICYTGEENILPVRFFTFQIRFNNSANVSLYKTFIVHQKYDFEEV